MLLCGFESCFSFFFFFNTQLDSTSTIGVDLSESCPAQALSDDGQTQLNESLTLAVV